MYYEVNDFEELIKYIASLETLELPYIIQRDTREVKTLFGFFKSSDSEPVWKIQVIEYVQESGELIDETEIGTGNESESQDAGRGQDD